MGLVSLLLRSSSTLSSLPLNAATRRAVLAASASDWGNREWPTKLVVRVWKTRRLRLAPGLPDLASALEHVEVSSDSLVTAW